MKRIVLGLVINAILFSGCSSRFIETDLYFGFSKPAGDTISQHEWQNFMQTHISRVFVQGFTVIPAQGKWLDDSTHILISEPSALVIAVHKKDKALHKQIDSLTATYKVLFQQQAVLRVDKKVTVKL